MLFDFDFDYQYRQTIDIVDIGNFGIHCIGYDRYGGPQDFYLCTRTVLGKIAIFKFGPILPDLNAPLDGYTAEYKYIDYKETKINKEISSFIKDSKKGINEIEPMLPEEIFKIIPDLEETYYNM